MKSLIFTFSSLGLLLSLISCKTENTTDYIDISQSTQSRTEQSTQNNEGTRTTIFENTDTTNSNTSSNTSPNSLGEVDSHSEEDEISRAFSNLDIPQEKLVKMAKTIFQGMNSVSEKYLISDNIALTIIVLRNLAEIGVYEVAYKDIRACLEGFLKLAETTLSKDIWDVIHQIKKIKLGKQGEEYFVQAFTKTGDSLKYFINEPMGDDFLEDLEIPNKTKIFFNDVDSIDKKVTLIGFLKSKVSPIFLLPGTWFKKLNQIHEAIPRNIDHYLSNTFSSNDIYLTPIHVHAKNTKIHLRSRSIKIKQLYALPGIKDGEEPLPSTVIRGKTGLFPLKFSIDQ